jgi:hypothetical protein
LGLSDKSQTSNSTTSGKSSISTPDTPDIIAARKNIGQSNPSIGYGLGEAQRNLKETYQNPLGGYATPQIRDAVLRSGNRELAQQAGEQSREQAYDANRQRLALAGLTKGQVDESSGQMSGKIKQSESPWGAIFNAAAGAAQSGMSM